jgi:hypothetical protein
MPGQLETSRWYVPVSPVSTPVILLNSDQLSVTPGSAGYLFRTFTVHMSNASKWRAVWNYTNQANYHFCQFEVLLPSGLVEMTLGYVVDSVETIVSTAGRIPPGGAWYATGLPADCTVEIEWQPGQIRIYSSWGVMGWPNWPRVTVPYAGIMSLTSSYGDCVIRGLVLCGPNGNKICDNCDGGTYGYGAGWGPAQLQLAVSGLTPCTWANGTWIANAQWWRRNWQELGDTGGHRGCYWLYDDGTVAVTIAIQRLSAAATDVEVFLVRGDDVIQFGYTINPGNAPCGAFVSQNVPLVYASGACIGTGPGVTCLLSTVP